LREEAGYANTHEPCSARQRCRRDRSDRTNPLWVREERHHAGFECSAARARSRWRYLPSAMAARGSAAASRYPSTPISARSRHCRPMATNLPTPAHTGVISIKRTPAKGAGSKRLSGRSSLRAGQFISSGSARASRKQPKTPRDEPSTSQSPTPASAARRPTCCSASSASCPSAPRHVPSWRRG
jgi:hypothetical protein